MPGQVQEPPEIAAWLARHARPLILEHYRADSCIESTAIAIDVLRAYGVGVLPVPVQVKIFNEPAWRLFSRGYYGKAPTERVAWDLSGAWSIGIGYIDTPIPLPGRYAGHLVALLTDGWLLDLSLDQASRPQHGMSLTPLLHPVDLRDLVGQKPIFSQDGTVLVYSLNTTIWAKTYRAAQAWKRKSPRREIVEEIKARYAASKVASLI
jgi:hypothetical protein